MTEQIFWIPGRPDVSFHYEVVETDAKRLALGLLNEFDQRDIPFEGRCGLVWEGCELENCKWLGVFWAPHRKLIRNSMALYHEDAIYPPALVLQPSGIIYGRVYDR
jgi:hypothetical protein